MSTQTVQPEGQAAQHAIINGVNFSFGSAREKFEKLAQAWDDNNLGLSQSNYQDPAHLQIIGMGEAAVPLLLDRVRRGERRWVYALRFITGEQPDTPEMRGDAPRVMQAWIDWGIARGLIDGRVNQR